MLVGVSVGVGVLVDVFVGVGVGGSTDAKSAKFVRWLSCSVMRFKPGSRDNRVMPSVCHCWLV